MPVNVPTLSGDIAEANYLVGRIMSGCAALIALGDFDDDEDAWKRAIEFGEWNPLNSAEEMPKVVVMNASLTSTDRGEDAGGAIPTGSIAVLVYAKAFPLAESESERHLLALNFYGDLVKQIYAQSGNLVNPGDQFANRTMFVNSITMTGPTRTSREDRGPANENDYFDGVLFIEWGEST